MEEELERDDEFLGVDGGAEGPLPPPRIEKPEPVVQNPNLTGVPLRFGEGMGLEWERDQEEAAQMQLQQVWRDTLDQSVVNSVVEYFQASPDAVTELFSSGTADLEPHRAELTEGIPLHLHDQVMGSLTLSGAQARADRIREDQRVQARLAQQVGLSRNAVMLAGGLLDADLPLMFASGGTLAAGRTALTVARTTRALTGSTALGRVTGDFAVGLSGGALSGAIVGGTGMMVRDDYDVNTMFQMVLASAATGGVLNPTIGRVLPDRDVWEQAANLEMQDAIRAAERRFHEDMVDPDSPINDLSAAVDGIDVASTPVPPARGPLVMELDAGGNPTRVEGTGVGAEQAQPVEREFTADRIGLGDSVPEGVRETSLRMQKWRQDYAFNERFAEDTKNPFVRLLTGNSDYTVRVPFTERDIPVGQLAGSVFTLAQRDFTKLVRSRSAAANFVAAEILESSSGLVRGGSSASVLREMFYSSALVHSATPLRDFRASYYRSRGLSPVRIDSQRQFSADLRLQMQRRYMGQQVDAEFVDVIDRIDQTHREILGHLQGIDADRAVRGAREIEHRPGYFRYAWEPERFLAVLRREGGENALRQAFRDGYMKASGIDKATAESIAKAVVRRFRTRGVGRDAADSRLLDLDSRAGIEEVLEGSGMARKEIDRILASITAHTQERTKKGYLKQRIEVDLSTRIPGSQYRLVDLMSDDFERTMHQYVGDASGAAALAHKGIRDKAELNNLIDTIMEEQFALGETALQRPEVEAIFSQFTGGAHRGFIWGHETSGVSPLTNTLTKATRASLLQRAGLTQLMDTANLFVGNGVARTMEPIMAKLGWADGALSKADMQSLADELDSIGVVAGRDHDIFAPHMTIDETELAQNVLMNAAQRGMSSIERATHFVSGQIHVTAFQQQIAASAVTTNVIKTLAGQETNLTTRMLRDIGLEPDRIHEITDLIEQGVIKVDGSKIELNSDQWSPDLKLEFGAAITRAMHQQVQKGLIGETSVWMNSDIGKLLSALKTFALVATQKQMARNLMIGGSSHFVTASAWQMGFAYAVLTLAQGIQGTEMSPADRGWLAAAYTPNIGTIPMLVDPMTSMMGFEDLNFSPYGRYASYIDTPVFEVAQRLSQAPGGAMGMLSGEGTYNDMQNARAMFFLNWYGMKRLWEEM